MARDLLYFSIYCPVTVIKTVPAAVAFAHKWEVADLHHENCLDKCCNVGRLDVNQWYPGWCIHYFAHLLPGDFNVDGYCDFACIDKYGMVYTTYWLPDFNKLRFPEHITSYLCDQHQTYYPLVYDVDKDGIDDILCVKDVTRGDGKVTYRGMRGRHPYILYGTWPDNIINNNGVTSEFIINEPKQNYAVKQMECSKFNNECNHVTLEIVHQFIVNTWCSAAGFTSGVIDGDGYCDAICNGAYLYVLYFVADIGRFQVHSHRYNASGLWSVTQGYCTSSLKELQILDINRDGIHDLVCTPLNDASNPYMINTILGVSLVDISLGSNIVDLHVMLEEVRKKNNIDQAMSCSVRLDSTNSINTVNPCSNVTRLSAYLQANAVSVVDAQFGFFCKNSDTAQFISDGVTYSKRIDSPVNTAGQGEVFTCSDRLYTLDLNSDDKWDLVCTDTTIYTGAQVFYWMSPADGNGFNSATSKEQMTMDGNPECRHIVVTNGVVIYSYNGLEHRHIGSVAQISCQDNTFLRGYLTPVCLANRNWSWNNWKCIAINNNRPTAALPVFGLRKDKTLRKSPVYEIRQVELHRCLDICVNNIVCWAVVHTAECSGICLVYAEADLLNEYVIDDMKRCSYTELGMGLVSGGANVALNDLLVRYTDA